jgi:hypothetical protein
MIKKPEEIIQEKVNPSKPRGGLGGLLDYAKTRNNDTGLSRMQNFAAALDPLILPEMRAGEAIRERGMQRVAAGNKNKTIQMLIDRNRQDLADLVQSGAVDAGQAINYMMQEANADKQFGRQKELIDYKAGLEKPDNKALTQIAKLNQDLQAGRINEEQYNIALSTLANKNKMSIRTNADGTMEFVQGSDPSAKMTEAESKNLGFYKRSKDALELFNPVADSLTDKFGALTELDPTGVSRVLQSDEFQEAQVLGKDFLAPILRKDTGAAVTPSEWVFYKAIYIPEVGDNPAKLEQKKQARKRAVEAMKISMPPHLIVKLEKEYNPEINLNNMPMETFKPTHRFNETTGKVELIK